MRIISQDGTTDVPYEHVAVIRLNKKIYFFNSNLITDSQALAEYSAEAKAIKAMEMLREAYAGKPILNVDELPNLAPQDFRGKLETGDILLCDKVNADVSFSSNYYFQFPRDDEVEV